jgi:hypothetical protein
VNNDVWPLAQLDRVQRLRVLAASLPGASMHERIVPAPFDQVWNFFSDMERSLPSFDQAVGEFRIVERDGTRLVARARSPRLRVPFTFDIDLEPGWCLMTARPGIYVVGFAAQPDNGQTRFGHVESYNLGGPGWIRAAIRPLLALTKSRQHSHVVADVDGIEAALDVRPASDRPDTEPPSLGEEH